MRLYSLAEIYQQASTDVMASEYHGNGYTSYISYGVKIIRDSKDGAFYIYNIGAKGDFPEELNEQEYSLFLTKGWKYGVCSVSLSNYRNKLDIIQLKIRDVMNSSRSDKQVQTLQDKRDTIMQRYNELLIKLNKLKS